jgi:hypothetical protein
MYDAFGQAKKVSHSKFQIMLDFFYLLFIGGVLKKLIFVVIK